MAPLPVPTPDDGRPRPARPLTQRQQAVLDALVRLRVRHGCSPTLRELGAECGIASTAHLHFIIGALARKGYLRRGYATARGIELLAPALPGGWPYTESPT